MKTSMEALRLALVSANSPSKATSCYSFFANGLLLIQCRYPKGSDFNACVEFVKRCAGEYLSKERWWKKFKFSTTISEHDRLVEVRAE